MTASTSFRPPPPDCGSVTVIANTQADANRVAGLYQTLIWTQQLTVREINTALLALAEIKGPPGPELHRRLEVMRQDHSLLQCQLPLGELVEVVKRISDTWRWLAEHCSGAPRCLLRSPRGKSGS
jgi:hypothetical protein